MPPLSDSGKLITPFRSVKFSSPATASSFTPNSPVGSVALHVDHTTNSIASEQSSLGTSKNFY